MRPFEDKDNATISTWFKDGASQKWLESPWKDEELAIMKTESHGRVYVAEVNEGIVGLIGCYLASSEYAFHHISEIHVAPESRRIGVAREMLKWMTERRHPAPEWRVAIHPENQAAIHLFESERWESMHMDHGLRTYRKAAQKCPMKGLS
ncbi:MAG: GNAT family N-acetyltransferase [Verrucomicrobia bacterium]|nr:GNAT family N-acetyltransferase [Verrucomicrobiota bacterium]MCH8512368.1 GNAT family N-acetyltransferase [Kiritimatiellia bacterium]